MTILFNNSYSQLPEHFFVRQWPSPVPGAKLIPMGSIPANLQALDSEEPVVCYCHHGMRSLDVTVWLRSQGVENVRSLAGGIDRWSLEIDQAVPRY